MPSFRKNALNMLSLASGKLLTGMSVGDREAMAHHIAHQRSRSDVTAFASFAKEVVAHYHGISNTLWTNGEKVLIDRLGPLSFKMIFDAGANEGKWSKLAYEAHAEAAIHAFEIVPDTFAIMKDNIGALSDRVTLNSMGLADAAGSVSVRVDPNSTVLSSMLPADTSEGDTTVTIDCKVSSGAAYCQQHGIDRIDFLKIDVEGAEEKVIKGFEPLIKAKKIRLVQFEYNRGAIVSGFLLRDFYRYFEPKGYVLGKLFPDGVQFHDYTFAHEDFRGPNYVACLADETKIIDAISL